MPTQSGDNQSVERELFNEKVKRLDDKIDQSQRYLIGRCEKLNEKILATEKLLSTVQDNAKEAVKVANDSSKLRFESFNEFNTRMTQMTNTFFTISSFEQFRNAYDSWKLDTNRKLDRREGESQGIKLTGGTMMSAVMIIAALMAIIAGVISWTSRTPPTPQVIYSAPPPATK
jgi:hypothetical protein